MGTTADTDPVNGWIIVSGKLYMNCNHDVLEKWMEDIPGNIKKADKNWPGVLE